jgi:hypothetical protein
MADVFCSYIKPMKLTREARLSVLQEPFRESYKKHAIVANVSMEDVEKFFKEFRSQGIGGQIGAFPRS